MKTATITFHSPNNNGSFLQAYALQQVLKNIVGVDNEIIDFRSQKQQNQYALLRPVRNIRDLVKNAISLLHYKKLSVREQRYEQMRKEHLRMTSRCTTEKEVERIIEKYDCVIAGSDQIWNTSAPDYSPMFMLPGIKTRKISYAVSMGSYATAPTGACANAIREFAAVSVREPSVQRKLEGIVDTAVVSPDPTLLLEKSQWTKLSDSIPLVEGKYIFFYSINYHQEALEAVRLLGKELQMPVYTVFTSFHTLTCEKYGVKVLYDYGPKEFLNCIQHATLVATNSFHGTAFSIIMKKRFLHLCDTRDGQIVRDDRINDLLDTLGLSHHDFKVGDTIDWNILSSGDDWSYVDEQLKILRRDAIEYLQSALQIA